MERNIYNSYDEIPFDIIKKFCLEQSMMHKISLHNTICWDIISDGIDVIYDMDEFAEEMRYAEDPLWLANRIYYGNFKPCDDYWKFNGYGNLVSYSYGETEELINTYLDDELSCYDENSLRRVIIRDWFFTEEEILKEINEDVDGIYNC